MTSPVIETSRLLLRRFRDDDFEALASIFGDPDVMRHLQDGVPVSREESAVHFRNLKENYWAERGFGRLAVVSKDSGEVVGFCGLRLLDGTPEIVYVLAKSHWGRGLATEAARACLRFAFEQHGFERVVAITRPPNAASRRVMERLGMKFVREDDFYGYNCVLYSIERADYKADDEPYRLVDGEP
ncbi:MAG TPA: GNAT family N-acetyltransferase [Pyrinomonadaceae bacterium]|nr:GNAT family N-acetyltransferase [Pyrinomonadaceae bacterium]